MRNEPQPDTKVLLKKLDDSIFFATQAWFYQKTIEEQSKIEKNFVFLNNAPNFWTHHREMSIKTTIVSLGVIFDEDGKTQNIDFFVNAVKETISKLRLSPKTRPEIEI